MGNEYIIGIDLGGTKISGAIAHRDGRMLYSMTIPTLAAQGAYRVAERIVELIRALIEKQGASKNEISGIGIGSPGFVNSNQGVIAFAANLPGFNDFHISDFIEDRLGITTYVENDAKAAALGEMWFGAGRGCSNFIFMTISTGIGGAIVADGDIFAGMSNTAGEIGHMIINPEGPLCGCGHRGCLEAYASGTAIARMAAERLTKGEDSLLREYKTVTSREVFEVAARGDRLALSVLDCSLHYLGVGVANLITLINPERVIIGGGVSMAGDIIFDRVWKEIRENSFKPMYENLSVVPAELKTDAGVIGALGVVLTRLRCRA